MGILNAHAKLAWPAYSLQEYAKCYSAATAALKAVDADVDRGVVSDWDVIEGSVAVEVDESLAKKLGSVNDANGAPRELLPARYGGVVGLGDAGATSSGDVF